MRPHARRLKRRRAVAWHQSERQRQFTARGKGYPDAGGVVDADDDLGLGGLAACIIPGVGRGIAARRGRLMQAPERRQQDADTDSAPSRSGRCRSADARRPRGRCRYSLHNQSRHLPRRDRLVGRRRSGSDARSSAARDLVPGSRRPGPRACSCPPASRGRSLCSAPVCLVARRCRCPHAGVPPIEGCPRSRRTGLAAATREGSAAHPQAVASRACKRTRRVRQMAEPVPLVHTPRARRTLRVRAISCGCFQYTVAHEASRAQPHAAPRTAASVLLYLKGSSFTTWQVPQAAV
jgi:hypothetical protein